MFDKILTILTGRDSALPHGQSAKGERPRTRRPMVVFDRRLQELEEIKAELARCREEDATIREELVAAVTEIDRRRIRDQALLEQTTALRADIDQDRRRMNELTAKISETQRCLKYEVIEEIAAIQQRQKEMMRIEAETRRQLDEIKIEMTHCLEEQSALRRALEAERVEVEISMQQNFSPNVEASALLLTNETASEASASTAKIEWTVRGQSVVKPRNDSFIAGDQILWRKNEDRLRLSETESGFLAAVSDGAGASGLFCGAWAETLLDHLPDRHLTGPEDLNSWLDGFCLDFYHIFSKQTKSDPRKHSKFVREGSFATLATCRLERKNAKAICFWSAYGDSSILIFDRTKGDVRLIFGYPETLSAFDRDPHLLNWKTQPTPSLFKTGEITLPKRATVVLASDGVGQFLFLRYLATLPVDAQSDALLAEFHALAEKTGSGSRVGSAISAHLTNPAASFVDEMAEIRNVLAAEASFASWVEKRCEENLLPNDDATIVMIDVESSEAFSSPIRQDRYDCSSHRRP
ncbi:hypothetical protein CCP2SC5_210024 [Azospirillaceae bacterium]